MTSKSPSPVVIERRRSRLWKTYVRPISRALRSNSVLRELAIGYTGGQIALANGLSQTVRSMKDLPDFHAILAHDTLALPAAVDLAGRRGACPIAYDVVETPWPKGRTGEVFRNLPMTGIARLRRMELKAVAQCATIISPSEPLSERLRHRYKRDVSTIWHSRPPFTGKTKKKSEQNFANTLVLHGTHSAETGCLRALEVLACLPEAYGLHVIGQFQVGVEDRFDALAGSLNLSNRIEKTPWISSQQLYGQISRADCGLVLFDPGIANVSLNLPHRAFDLMACGVPIVTSGNEALSQMTAQSDGIVFKYFDPQLIAAETRRIVEESDRKALRQQQHNLAQSIYDEDEQGWKQVFERLKLQPGQRLALLACKDVTGNTRISRIHRIANEQGLDTVVIAMMANPEADLSALGPIRLTGRL